MDSINISIVAFVLGLFPIWRMFAFEKAAGASLFPFATMFFFAQHMAYSLMGALVSIADNQHAYLTEQGIFEYSDGMIRWQIVNLVAVFSGWLSVELIKRVQTTYPTTTSGEMLRGNCHGLCYISLGFHALIISSQWVIQYADMPEIARYVTEALSTVAVATFYFWGVCWYQMSHGRLLFIAYAFVYGGVQLLSGNRGPFVIGMFLFLFGYFLNRGRRAFGLDIVIFSSLIAAILFALNISENIRILYGSRRPGSVGEWVARLGDFSMKGSVSNDSSEELPGQFIARAAATVMQYSPFDVVARTPEDVPFKGWAAKDWDMLFDGFLPSFNPYITEDSAMTSGSLATREYGWNSEPGSQTTAFPMTLMADSWRRFGYNGVIGVHFIWAVLLVSLSEFLGKRNTNQFVFILSGAFISIIYHLYVWDILALIAPLPRRMVICLGYAVVIYLGTMIFTGNRQSRLPAAGFARKPGVGPTVQTRQSD